MKKKKKKIQESTPARNNYIIEIFDHFSGWLKFDNKANKDSADTIADVISKSRKAWMRVVHEGKVIISYDRRKKKRKLD